MRGGECCATSMLEHGLLLSWRPLSGEDCKSILWKLFCHDMELNPQQATPSAGPKCFHPLSIAQDSLGYAIKDGHVIQTAKVSGRSQAEDSENRFSIVVGYNSDATFVKSFWERKAAQFYKHFPKKPPASREQIEQCKTSSWHCFSFNPQERADRLVQGNWTEPFDDKSRW